MNRTLALQVINEASTLKFEWGSWDCCLFAARVASAVLGRQVADKLIGTYKSEDEASDIIRLHGGIQNLVSQHLWALPRVGFAGAEDGDPVLVALPSPLGHGHTVGVSFDSKLVFKSETGISWISRELAVKRVLCHWRLEECQQQ